MLISVDPDHNYMTLAAHLQFGAEVGGNVYFGHGRSQAVGRNETWI